MRVWRNWQTRMIQVHIGAIRWRFKSSYPHQKEVSPSVVLLFLLLAITSIRLTEQQVRQETLADWVGKNKKETGSPPLAASHKSGMTTGNPVSNTTVAQNADGVNTQSMQDGEDYSRMATAPMGLQKAYKKESNASGKGNGKLRRHEPHLIPKSQYQNCLILSMRTSANISLPLRAKFSGIFEDC